MLHIGISLIGLVLFVTPSSGSTAFGLGVAKFPELYRGNAYVLAQYITREEQQKRAEQNLKQHREEQKQQEQKQQERSNSEVNSSTNSYGKEYLEQQLQGDKPRVIRPW
jgi:hypothetical protein